MGKKKPSQDSKGKTSQSTKGVLKMKEKSRKESAVVVASLEPKPQPGRPHFSPISPERIEKEMKYNERFFTYPNKSKESEPTEALNVAEEADKQKEPQNKPAPRSAPVSAKKKEKVAPTKNSENVKGETAGQVPPLKGQTPTKLRKSLETSEKDAQPRKIRSVKSPATEKNKVQTPTFKLAESNKENEGANKRPIKLEIDLEREMHDLDRFFTVRRRPGSDFPDAGETTPAPLRLTESDITSLTKRLSFAVTVKPRHAFSTEDDKANAKRVSAKPRVTIRHVRKVSKSKPAPKKRKGSKVADKSTKEDKKGEDKFVESFDLDDFVEVVSIVSEPEAASEQLKTPPNSGTSSSSSEATSFNMYKPPYKTKKSQVFQLFSNADEECEKDEELEISFSSDNSDESPKPDMSWITGFSEDETNDTGSPEDTETTTEQEPKPKGKSKKELFPGIRRLLQLVTILGRYPFVIYVDESGTFQSRMKKTLFRLDFFLITLFTLIALLMCMASTTDILFSSSESSSPYEKFEKLLMQKHWLYISLFALTTILAVIGSLSIIFQAKSINKCINDFGKSLGNLKYRGSTEGFVFLMCVYIIITVMDVVVLVLLVLTNKLEFGEKQRFESMLYLRWFHVDAFRTPTMDIFKYVMLVCEIYIYFAARNMLVFILIFCQTTVNVAQEWNSRLKILLRKDPAEEIKKMGNKLSLTNISHENLVAEHWTITNFVKKISSCFPVILSIFFITRILCICCELFKLASLILFDLRVKVKAHTVENAGVKYESTDEEKAFEVMYFLTTTLIFAFLTSINISDVGDAVMNGFGPVRRHGLMLANSLTERKFIMTMYMSFNGKSPHIVKPGAFFVVDRGHILRIIGGALLIVSIMIQCQVVNLIEVPIVLPCAEGSGLCSKSVVINPGQDSHPSDIIENSKNKWVTVPPAVSSTPTASIPSSSVSSVEPTTTIPISTTPKPTKCLTRLPDPKPFLKLNDPKALKIKECGFFCPGTQVYRISPRDEYGKKLLKEENFRSGTSVQLDKTLNCIGNTYADILDRPVYDCFGNCHNPLRSTPNDPLLDPLNRFPFSLYQNRLASFGASTVFQNNNMKRVAGFNAQTILRCYYEPLNNIDRFHPLELCGMPYAYLALISEYIARKDPMGRELQMDMWKRQEEGLWGFLNNTIKVKIKAKCTQTFPGVNPAQSFDPQILEKITYDGMEFLRLKAFSFAYQPLWVQQGLEFRKGFPIPLASEKNSKGDVGKFAKPYSYLHPQIITQPGNRLISFGYFDCFGKPLDEFDDCGGLPFSIAYIENGLQLHRKPNKNFHTDNGNYFCWESWIPNYECGVESSRSDRRKELCDFWRTYAASLQ